MKKWLFKLWREQDGVLSFEWTLLASLLTVGAVSGITAVRDATIDEMGDLAQAMLSLDQSYTIQAPLVIGVHNFGYGGGFGGGFGGSNFGGFGTSGASNSYFVDAMSYRDCQRGHMRVHEFPGAQRGTVDEDGAPIVPAEPLAQ